MLKWIDYNYEKYKAIDDWNQDNIYGDIINKYAMFDEPLSETFKWYQENKMGKIKDVIKVIEDPDNNILGFIILNISQNQESKKLLIGINPIVVNPSVIANGYGKRIIKDLIDNYIEIINVSDLKYSSVLFTAGISESNARCIKMFLSSGFIKTGIHEDGTFGYYELNL